MMNRNYRPLLKTILILLSMVAHTTASAQADFPPSDSLVVLRPNTIYHSSFDNGEEEPFYHVTIPQVSLLEQDILPQPSRRAYFPGCEDRLNPGEKLICSLRKLMQFIYADIHYPAEDREAGIMGMVVISVIIESNGLVSELYVLRSPGGNLGQAAYLAADRLRRERFAFNPRLFLVRR